MTGGLRRARGCPAIGALAVSRAVLYNTPMSGAAKSGAQGKLDTGSVLQGAIWMLLAALCFAAMNGVIRHLSTELHPFVIVFFRNFFGLAFMLPWILRGRGAGLKTDRLGLHFIRALIGLAVLVVVFTVWRYRASRR